MNKYLKHSTVQRPRWRRRLRRAVTILEVMFAIGVTLIGLLGLAALIPIASRFASDTLTTDRAAAMASAFDQSARISGVTNLRRLVILNPGDSGGNGTEVAPGQPWFGRQAIPVTWLPLGLYPDPRRGAAAPQDIYSLGQISSPGPVRAGTFTPAAGALAGTTVAPGRHGAICIDPHSMPFGPPTTLAGIADPNSFRPAYFPYYSPMVNPLHAPNEAMSDAPMWGISPRMWRATLLRAEMNDLENFYQNLANVNPGPQVSLIAPPLTADSIFRSADEINIVDPDDRSAFAAQQFFRTGRDTAGNRLAQGGVPLARANNPEFSWLATLVPQTSTGVEYELSIVVIRQRSGVVPSMNSATTNAAAGLVDPEDNFNAERITWVGQAIGLNGGAGGDILIYGSAAMSPDVDDGSWIMLSRQPWDNTDPGNPATADQTSTMPDAAGNFDTPDGDIDDNDPIIPFGPAKHGWYRVIKAGEVEFSAGGFAESNYPGGATIPCWRRWLRIEGADWNFQGAPNTSLASLADDTFCTIVDGAVAVRTSTIVLE